MSISYQMENEVKYQKQRVKELEDYLDNLLLRVMETHPKILQSPYTKLNTKSGWGGAEGRDFLTAILYRVLSS